MTVSPLAPSRFPDLPAIRGVEFATIEAGVRYNGRTDVMLARLAKDTAVAGVFTRSATRSAAVRDCQDKLAQGGHGSAAILVNSGNANTFTGQAGDDAVHDISAAVSAKCGIDQTRVFTSSTGVIGELLPTRKIVDAIPALLPRLSQSSFQDAAKAIMTTDTFAKGSTRTVDIDGEPITINGIAKGSGMIAPDMATMLVYIFTDAKIAQPALQSMTSRLADKTFNCITVDSDTSTSDTLLMCATGASDVDVATHAGFEAALHEVMLDLAHQVVRDGEGATKFITVKVSGAASDADANRVGFSIANSPLVKTAVAGEDPNWGRVVMAVGKSGAQADRDLLTIHFGDILVAEKGWVSSNYTETAGATYMKDQDITIAVDLGLGEANATVWTCDLTHAYIEINADYRS